MGRLRILKRACQLSLVASLLTGMSYMKKDDTRTLYGPDAFRFCGGWVELWVRAWNGDTEVLLKASPPKGTTWKIWSAHVVIPSFANINSPVRFQEQTALEVPSSKANILTLTLKGEPRMENEVIPVALRPFEGCTAGETERGVKLRVTEID